MSIVGCLLMLILIPLFIVFAFAGTIVSMLFGRRPNASFKWTTNMNGANQQSSRASQQSETSQQADSQKKIFSQDEGEYVDFEEVN